MDLNGMLWRAVELGASDVHLKHGQPPMLRRDGTIAPLEGWPALDGVDLDSILLTVASSSPAKLAAFRDTGDLDIAYEDEVDASIQTLTSIIEPLMMIGVGIMVGGIIIAMYMPMFKMLTLIK